MPSQAETIAALQGLNPVTTPQSPADPNAAAMTFGSALGLPDAIKALKGQLTPEEAQMFAVTSAMGMIPGAAPEKAAVKTMGELLPHLYPEASSFAKMTPKEYLGMFGSDLPKQLPQDVENVLKPYMQPAKAGKVPGPVQQFAPKEKPIGQSDIDKTLAANPGASIFDVAGTNTEGESSPIKKPWGNIGTETFPLSIFSDISREGGVQSVPLRAAILGRSENLVHGTRTPAEDWQTPTGNGASVGGRLDALRLPDDELGVHFGNPKAANEFSGSSVNDFDAPRQYPVIISANNPLRLPDLGSWQAPKVIRELRKQGFPQEELTNLNGVSDVRNYLSNKGYDSIVYKNNVEDIGHDSYIKFTPSSEAPDFVTGVRSPFAAFDPSKIMRPELAAGLAGGTLAAPAIDPNLLKALTGSPTDQQQ